MLIFSMRKGSFHSSPGAKTVGGGGGGEGESEWVGDAGEGLFEVERGWEVGSSSSSLGLLVLGFVFALLGRGVEGSVSEEGLDLRFSGLEGVIIVD